MIAKADILGRLKLASNSTSDADLARFLGIAPQRCQIGNLAGVLITILCFQSVNSSIWTGCWLVAGTWKKNRIYNRPEYKCRKSSLSKPTIWSISSAFPFTIWRRRPDWFPVQRCRCDSDQLYIVAGSACMRRGCLRARGFDVSITQKRRYCPLQAGTRHAVRDFLGWNVPYIGQCRWGRVRDDKIHP